MSTTEKRRLHLLRLSTFEYVMAVIFLVAAAFAGIDGDYAKGSYNLLLAYGWIYLGNWDRRKAGIEL